MRSLSPSRLTFAQVDDLAFAAERGRLAGGIPDGIHWTSGDLGPFIELIHLAASGFLPVPESGTWLSLDGMGDFYRAMTDGKQQWVRADSRDIGFLRTEARPPADTATWTAFGVAAQKAAVAAGFTNKVAGQLVGAILEMQSNIYEHSEAPQTGILTFRVAPGVFEFVVADQGIGVLESLRSGAAHASLADHGTALQLTLTEGCSRFGDGVGRGLGFRPLFVGLANLRGSLRFRSGDHALTIDGDHPNLVMARLIQKPPLRGFFASVRCIVDRGISESRDFSNNRPQT
jgi:anti-sigma regulatory factor (Ser/Thr protein kinase)